MRTAPTPFARHAAILAAGTLLVSAACASRDPSSFGARFASSAGAMSVACEPSQRAVVRPAGVNGATMPQVECVSAEIGAAGAGVQAVAYVPQPAVAPMVSYQPAPAYAPRVMPAAYTIPASTRRQVAAEHVQRYGHRPARSVTKSAIIIGSSAGAGAGLGAVIGGKKGAAIGALVGGGGATLWDQITRHKDR